MRFLGLFALGVFLLGLSQTPASPSVSRKVHSCPPAWKAPSLPRRRGTKIIHADVTGDGKIDLVSIRYAPRAWSSCGYFLTVKTPRRFYSARISFFVVPSKKMSVLASERWYGLREPYVGQVVQLAPRHRQIVVGYSHGASTSQVLLYEVVNGRLQWLRMPRMYGGQLSLFGSVADGDMALCHPGGPLTVASYGAGLHGRFGFSRVVYRLRGGRISAIWRKNQTIPGRKFGKLQDRWRLAATTAFDGCTVARGQRLS